MLIAALLGLVLASAELGLSAEGQLKIAPFIAAVKAAKAKQAAMAGQSDVQARLETLLDVDQEPLKALHQVGLSSMSPADRAAANALIAEEMSRISAANVRALVEMVPREGWFSSKVYGDRRLPDRATRGHRPAEALSAGHRGFRAAWRSEVVGVRADV